MNTRPIFSATIIVPPQPKASELQAQFVRTHEGALVSPDETITCWRDALSKCANIHKSRFGKWEPFITRRGDETTKETDCGTAYATDGVHWLLRTGSGQWRTQDKKTIRERAYTEPREGGFDNKTTAHPKGELKEPARVRTIRSIVDQYL